MGGIGRPSIRDPLGNIVQDMADLDRAGIGEVRIRPLPPNERVHVIGIKAAGQLT